MKHRTLVAFAIALGVSSIAAAGGSGHNSRYRVTTVESPADADPACLPGHVVRNLPWAVNDHGVLAGNYGCYIVGANSPVMQGSNAFVWSPWAGSQVIAPIAVDRNFAVANINNRSKAFGREIDANGRSSGFEWAPYGAYERVFVAPPECGAVDTAAAGTTDGFTVGYGLRPDATGAGTCSLRWLIRSPSGAISDGPAEGQPWDINSRHVAVGDAGSAAIRLHVISGRTRVLFAGSATTSGLARGINEDGEAAGYLSELNKFCGQAVAVRWDQDGRMQSLPHLSGQVSSRALGVGDEEVVGQSGPGLYCANPYSEDERAVIWKGRRATDLNTLIPGWLGVTLTRAVGVNRKGQIVAAGFQNDEPRAECPVLSWDENDNPILDYTPKCRNFHTYVLTPIR